jgi:hypothetical protein
MHVLSGNLKDSQSIARMNNFLDVCLYQQRGGRRTEDMSQATRREGKPKQCPGKQGRRIFP